VVLTLEDVQKQIKPTDAELKPLRTEQQLYANSIPQKIKARYILIRPREKLADQVSITPAELQHTTKHIRTTIASPRPSRSAIS